VELKDAFLALAQQDVENLKICLFVEYFGLPRHILNLFNKSAGQSSVIKMVLSSRPEPEFEEAFREAPSLRLEDLTSGDVRKYIEENLYSHSRMNALRLLNNKASNALVTSIVTRASGVFLWVVVVVRGLLEGLTDGSYIEELEQIVGSYPQELRKLYENMFDRMKPTYRLQAAKIFECISTCLDVEDDLPSALRLSFMDEGITSLSKEDPEKRISLDLNSKVSNIHARLRSCCCGLIEAHITPSSRKDYPTEDWMADEGRLSFLHRSVSEFLRQPEIRSQIGAECRGANFDPWESNLASILSCLKHKYFFQLRSYNLGVNLLNY